MITIKYIDEISLLPFQSYLKIETTNDTLPRIYVNPKTYPIQYLYNNGNGYDLITKIVKDKDMKNVVLNLSHDIRDVRILCGEIIDNGFESIKVI